MNNNTSLSLPLGWIIKPTKHIFSVFNGSTPSSSEPSYWNGNIYWVTPEDIGALENKVLKDTKRKITQEGYKSCGTQLVPINSIVLTTRAPVGNLALAGVPLCTNQGCKTLVPKFSNTYSDYFYFQLIARKEELGALSTGTTFQELGTTELLSFNLLYPSPSEQKAIARYLDRQTAKIDELIKVKKRLLELLDEKRRALITHAVTRGLNPDVPMRDSGVEWIGEVPKHWGVEFAKWLFKQIDDRSITGQEELLTVSHITGVTPRSEKDVNMFMAESMEGYKVCQSGDLVINTLWAWMGAMGVSFKPGIVSPSYHVYRPMGKYHPVYLDYLVRIPIFAEEAIRYSKGVWISRLRLYPEEFFQILLPVPLFEEQEEIAKYLVEETQKLDNLGIATKKTIDLLQERRTALITAAVTGQLKIKE
ncbi:restriction endonuclease subunit S [Planktothrix agardhii 1803]|jgi:type I restriction enzyme S subunit|uniref:restriction endonuclease subunit S n=1 Tax=Planktothrix agardhii TaxID=1160 RepID=UPI001F295A69|nr:restriction endonuclease subunit S [Planktothrix agardhii]MCF3571216.1 restriction endonuclease subunit S [Planktothrix agardhii 1805]MCF3585893.1 restriction endonuclease subunit S [Planktothrix agardhii 1803]MCF3623140.1 restriction endonuclease subunit S [Planktothrix agardhii 1030]